MDRTILDMVSIRERPAEAEDRAVPGHWKETFLPERTIRTSRHSSSATAALRCSSASKEDTTTVVATLAKHIRKLPEKAATLPDVGTKARRCLATSAFTVATNVQVYFCDPRSPWQRGSNENTTACCDSTFQEEPISRASPDYLNAIALRLNQRPAKDLGLRNPSHRLRLVLH